MAIDRDCDEEGSATECGHVLPDFAERVRSQILQRPNQQRQPRNDRHGSQRSDVVQ